LTITEICAGALLVACNVRVVLMAAPGGGNAQRAVNRQLRRNQTVLGRPPRGWRRVVLMVGALAVVIGVGAAWWLFR
jgi:hypothetical protein